MSLPRTYLPLEPLRRDSRPVRLRASREGFLAVLAAGACACLAACGSSSAASTSPTASGSAGAPGRGGAAGELVKIDGSTLIVNGDAGDVTVTVGSNTTYQRTASGTVADIVVGSCVIGAGQKDASGAVTANTVAITPIQNGTCPAGGQGQSRGTNGGNGNRGSFTPNPNAAFIRGQVTAVAGTSVTLRDAAGAATTITVPTTVTVLRSSPATLSSLATGDCVTAQGPRDSSGTVAARSVTVVPAGPSGCPTGRGGGFPFGGRGRSGGAGAGGGGGQGGAANQGAAPPGD